MSVAEILGLITAFIRDLGLENYIKAGVFIVVVIGVFAQVRRMLNG